MGTSTRLLAAIAALLAGIAAVVVAVAVLSRTSGPVANATSSQPTAVATTPEGAAPATASGIPAPPRSAVVFMHQDGASVVALAVTPKRRALGLQASVLSPQGTGTSGLAITFTVAGRSAHASTCGRGCYRANL